MASLLNIYGASPNSAGAYSGPSTGTAPQLNPDGSYRRTPLDGSSGGQSTPSLLDYNAWNNQQATPATNPTESGYGNYVNNYYKDNLGNPNALPQGFLNSSYGQPYLGTLKEYQNPLNANPQDEAGQTTRDQTLQWLQNAPQAYSGGRSLSQFQAPVGDRIYDAASIAVPAVAGAASGGLFNVGMAGVNASTQNSAPTPNAIPTRADVNQFANSGGPMNFVPGGGGNAEQAQGGLGAILAGGAGIAGAIDQQRGTQNYADWAKNQGQSYRDLLNQSYSNPSAYLSSPEVSGAVQQGTDALARSLSVHGNPIGSGGALQQLQSYATNDQLNRLAQYRQQLGGFGGLSAINQSIPGAATAAIGARGDIYNAGGSLLSDIFRQGGILGGSGGIFNSGVDQYGNPTAGNYAGGDPSTYGDQGGNWDPNTGLPFDTSQFDPNIDWSNLYG